MINSGLAGLVPQISVSLCHTNRVLNKNKSNKNKMLRVASVNRPFNGVKDVGEKPGFKLWFST